MLGLLEQLLAQALLVLSLAILSRLASQQADGNDSNAGEDTRSGTLAGTSASSGLISDEDGSAARTTSATDGDSSPGSINADSGAGSTTGSSIRQAPVTDSTKLGLH